MKKNMWNRIIAIGITFGMLVSSMPVSVYADDMFLEDDSYIVVEDETEEELNSEITEIDNETDYIDQSFISEDESVDDEGDIALNGIIDETEAELFAAEDGGIPIDEDHFPDPVFRQMVMEECDTDSDGVLSQNEISQVEDLDIYGYAEDEDEGQMSSLEGIEYFTELKNLYISEVNSPILDLSSLTALTYLECFGNNELQTVNVSGCISLLELECYSNPELRTINASGCTSLQRLDCSYYADVAGKVQDISLDGCTALEYFSCYGNRLETIDVSSCMNLETLICSNNQLTSLNISNNSKLKTLYCHENQLTDLNVRNNLELVELGCNNNQLTTLNVTNNHLLEGLYCSSNAISSLEIGSDSPLKALSCSHNNINHIDLSSFTALEKLWCGANPLDSLDVSHNTNLIHLHCFNSGLTELDVSNNPSLKELYCDHNSLENLSIQNCPYLQEVYTNGNHSSDDGVEKYEEYLYSEYLYEDRGLSFDSSVKVTFSVEQMYTITWDFNGGVDNNENEGPYSTTGAYGWSLIQPIIQKEGYLLYGWSKERDGELVLEVDETGLSSWTVDGDTTLYALWDGGEEEEVEYTPIQSGTCGEGLTWTLYEDLNWIAPCKLIIDGNGPMTDYDYIDNTSPFYNDGRIEEVYISEGVTSIGDAAFARCKNLREVQIPDTVTRIGSNAFQYCSELDGVHLPTSLQTIDTGAFSGCSSLTSIVFPEGIAVGTWAFGDCTSLSSVIVPGDITIFRHDEYSQSVFGGCEQLKTAGPIGGDYNFQYGWKNAIPEEVLCGSRLEEIVIADSIQVLEDRCFANCQGLKKITIPGSVQSIGEDVFDSVYDIKTAGPIGSGCDLEYGWTNELPERAFPSSINTVTLHEDLEELKKGRFELEGSSLSHVIILGSETKVEQGALDWAKLKSAGPIGNSCDIEFAWTSQIPDHAFHGCHSLVQVILPDTLEYIGKSAFAGSGITSVILPETVIEIGENAFEGCKELCSVEILSEDTTMGYNVFRGCDNLKSAGEIGSGCDIQFGWKEKIPQSAFAGAEIRTVTIPDGIKYIGANAFYSSKITSVTLPKTVIEIEWSAFVVCEELCSVEILSEDTIMGTSVFKGCDNLKSAGGIGSGCDIQFGWKKIPEHAFWESELEEVIIPEGVSSIESSAFSHCDKLSKLIIPKTVTSMGPDGSDYGICILDCQKLVTAGPIGSGCNIEYAWTTSIPKGAFAGHDYLKQVIIPDGIGYTPDYAFYSCDNLEYVVIPESVQSFGTMPFDGCTKLKTAGPIGSGSNIEYGWSTSFPRYAFSSFASMTSITIPNSVTSFGDGAFWGCKSLASIVIPDSVTRLGGNTFNGCSNLTNITIPKSVTEIGAKAFNGCSNLRDVYYGGTENEWNNIQFGSDVLNELANTIIHFNSIGEKSVSGILREGDGWAIKWRVNYSGSDDIIPDAKLSIYLEGSNKEDGSLFLHSNLGNGFTMPWLTEEYGFDKSDFVEITITGGIDNPFEILSDQFSGYSNVSRVYLKIVKSIQSGAFSECQNLVGVSYDDTLEAIYSKAFYGDVVLTSVASKTNISNIETIGAEAFAATNLQSFDFTGAKTIGEKAFCETELGRTKLPRCVSEIERDAFKNCDNLVICCYYGTVAYNYAVDNNIPYSLLEYIINAENYDINVSGIVGDRSFDDYLNTIDSTVYNPGFAYIMAGLCSAAYGNGTNNSMMKLWNSLKNLGFDSNDFIYDHFNNYDKYPAYIAAKKEMSDGTTLILVVLRGTYGGFFSMEALFTDGDFGLLTETFSGRHNGFEKARDEVLGGISTLVGSVPTSNVKYVLTGHSLGGATANLIAEELSQRGVPKSSVYNYNFACPDVAKLTPFDWNRDGEHDNIFNIGFAKDPVPVLPGVLLNIGLNPAAQWGKFGKSYWFSEDWNSPSCINIGGFECHHCDQYLSYLEDYHPESSFRSWFELQGLRTLENNPVYWITHIFCCPVDIMVRDRDGNVIATIIDNQADYLNSSFGDIILCVDGDKKAVCIPSDKDYTIDMIGSADGEMTYYINKVNIGAQEVVSQKVYNQVKLKDGKSMTTTSDGSSEVFVVEDNNIVAQINEDGSESKHVHSWDSGKVSKEATTSSNGINIYTCTVCGETKTESIPMLKKTPAAPATPEALAVSSEKITISKKPTIKKPASAKGKITVNWKHFKNTSKKGKKIWKPIKKVQVQCATDKAFSNIVKNTMIGKKKTKTTIKGLAKKTTYYVRVRYYDGTGYSAWSGVKKVKTK